MRRYSKEEKDEKYLNNNKRKAFDSDSDSKSSPKSSVYT